MDKIEYIFCSLLFLLLFSCNNNDEIGVFHSNTLKVEILNDKYFLEKVSVLKNFDHKKMESIYESTLILATIHLPYLEKYRSKEKNRLDYSFYLVFRFAQKKNLDRHVNSILKLDYNNLYLKDSTFVLEKFKS